jgi:predicted RNase H-like nuclease (RuvC/YqgF family)
MMTQTRFIEASWNPLTIGLMILGFVIFWPLGLAVIAYVLWGDSIGKSVKEMSDDFNSHCGKSGGKSGGKSSTKHRRRSNNHDNSAFAQYRQQEIDRLEEERRKLDEMRDEFDDFLNELRQAKDKTEFDRFMDARRKG